MFMDDEATTPATPAMPTEGGDMAEEKDEAAA